ncbi:MAG: hypothetical protein A3G52_00875 [Candidatus Taylorbacteria bacterium RIFCSPLOWO2_12_FULL_43_20]|uniref:AtpZ/AtpI family protein n=2 Tax=Parcubacteria group TaxID=1794811 RepID=A0A1G2UQI2_9BACT|nr:MAG: hypothetical protein A2825_03320 [Candidatus Taylorbacteria bacterium RIFCSPHIGHO2_01_FULL_43_120]OHA23711.1 MAG: hypothetical protein A3B98_00725 [Candidatus Taylorbacteria bacterium RIFCSPHIGHO2_02_FULL_43_55]OHA27964.1 MAG: hypothetical protein A3E92_03040 [Candidatus Taylorbacteria bacterium RIFCSPHIGHO2_12_FULL_42_34]OHA32059.1 MAG: hypothetical protein A3B09_02920 [Candidatus Taylorbacteria bacterium RIFCSPLOWO2_01_FULL_43_83]OHA39809.1 MAG: hypothetical protein A3H58_03695 [Candi
MDNDNLKETWWKLALQIFSQVSVWIVAPILVAIFLGKYLDERYGTNPWLFLALTGLAFIISSFGIVRTVTRYISRLEKEQNGKTDRSK